MEQQDQKYDIDKLKVFKKLTDRLLEECFATKTFGNINLASFKKSFRQEYEL